MIRLVAATSLLALAGCGPSFKMEPLVGEDPAILQVMGVTASDLETPETAAAVERFYRALWKKQASAMWSLISRDTRAALDALGSRRGTNGRGLLQSRVFPRLEGKGTVNVSLAALFLVRRPVRFIPEAEPGADNDTAVVIAQNRMGTKRRVLLRRERGAWVVHQPEFKELPPIVDLKPRLLPSDQAPKGPEPEPGLDEPEEPNDPEPEEPTDPEPEDPDTPEGTDPDEPPQRRNPDLDF